MEKLRIRDGKKSYPGSGKTSRIRFYVESGSEYGSGPSSPKTKFQCLRFRFHNTEITEVVLWIRKRFGTGSDPDLPLVN